MTTAQPRKSAREDALSEHTTAVAVLSDLYLICFHRSAAIDCASDFNHFGQSALVVALSFQNDCGTSLCNPDRLMIGEPGFIKSLGDSLGKSALIIFTI